MSEQDVLFAFTAIDMVYILEQRESYEKAPFFLIQ